MEDAPSESAQDRTPLFEEFVGSSTADMLALCRHAFGNYVVQKFLACCTPDQCQRIFRNHLVDHIYSLSLHQYGCRVVQKVREALRRAGLHVLTGACVQAFAVLPLAQQLAMFAKLCQGDESLADGASPLMACCLHQHGNHVVQKAVTCLPAERLQSLVDECAGHLGSVSCDSYGCRVVQRLLERCTADQRQVLVPPLLRLAPTLMVDPFGNYILHHLLEFGEPQARCVFDSALLHAGVTHGSVFAIAAGLLSLR